MTTPAVTARTAIEQKDGGKDGQTRRGVLVQSGTFPNGVVVALHDQFVIITRRIKSGRVGTRSCVVRHDKTLPAVRGE